MPKIRMITKIPMNFGTLLLLSHLIKGKNNNAINIDAMSGTKIKDNIFSK
jgi:hypothetical protein